MLKNKNRGMIIEHEMGLNTVYFPRRIRRFAIIKEELEGRVLDVGCANGVSLDFFQHDNIEGIEPGGRNVQICKKKGYKVKKGNIYKLKKLVKGNFDTVVCICVFPHLMDIGSALLSIQTVLKKNGKLIVTIPNCYAIGRLFSPENYTAEDYHYHLFDEIHMRNILKDTGFKVEKVNYIPNRFWSQVFTAIWKRFADDLVFICRKK